MRSSGILLHITSLPSPYGIGTLGREAEKFVDWLKKAGQKYWQILPLSPTGYGNSPYQSFSTFAGNPLLIDLDELIEEGALDRKKCEREYYGDDLSFIDFEKVIRTKFSFLEEAFEHFSENVGYLSFIQQEAFWLDDYALYMAIKEANGQKSWTEWEKDLQKRAPKAMIKANDELYKRVSFYKFIQYIFARQWQKLHCYANKSGVEIIGDLPIYVASDSADVWANSDLFKLDDDFNPTHVAGVPPDYFSETGQLWGNPLYDWEKMKSENYIWWVSRIKKSLELFDCVRIDHFRAFDTYYAIPANHKNAVNGKWETGPRMELWDQVKKEIGEINVIAEDLGEMFDSVRDLLSRSGFPGMRVLQFGFNPENEDNDHLPHRYPYNSVAYTGTHDNSTFKGWYNEASYKIKKMAKNYLCPRCFESMSNAALRVLYGSPSKICIAAMQDVLTLDNKARMNLPSTIGGNNWIWRMKPGAYKEKHARFLRALGEAYFRT
ncbi:MAG: 4-alpha-glucanotransferase [Eubacterium sp.]|jgi:4-alpha-glucanotransferase|nr:4-alpha-glucanotransferase [Eubacterium sp.]